MGDYTYTEFQDKLKFEMGQRTDVDAYRDDWINIAYRELTSATRIFTIKRYFYFPELETVDTSQSTTDGTAYINRPTDCLIVRQVYDTANNVRLKPIAWDKYTAYTDRATATAEGKPTEWVRSGTYLYLYKTPDATYTINVFYKKRVALLSASTDVTVLGAEWDEPILKLAVYKSFMRMKQYEAAKIEKAEWIESVAGLMDIYYHEEKGREEYLKPDPQYHQWDYD